MKPVMNFLVTLLGGGEEIPTVTVNGTEVNITPLEQTNQEISEERELVQEEPWIDSLLLKSRIESAVNIWETGSRDGEYDCISIYNDGRNNQKQITFGRSQTTSEGHLEDLLKLYIEKGGIYANYFRPFIGRIKNPSIVNEKEFIANLRKAGKEDPIMRQSQDQFFDKHYYNKALAFFRDNGFTLPLSLLVIYDSTIHSGSVPMWLRDKFSEKIPVNGGDEKLWIKAYLNTRHNWLLNKSPLLAKTTYRTKTMIDLVKQDKWQLNEPFYAHGGTMTRDIDFSAIVEESTPTTNNNIEPYYLVTKDLPYEDIKALKEE